MGGTVSVPSDYCTVSHIIVTSPQVGWLFFKGRAKRPYLH